MTLWAHFAGNRSGITWRAFASLLGPTAAAGMIAGVLLLLAGPGLAEWLSHGRDFRITELIPFAVLLLLMGAHAPSGAFLSDAHGLRFQARGTTVMACLSVGLTWWLSPGLGAAAPSPRLLSRWALQCSFLASSAYAG